jgi:ABC-type multidrug transport system fused ATPase/permease subunit
MKEADSKQKTAGRRMVGGLFTIVNFVHLKKLFSLFGKEYGAYRWHIVLLGFLSFFGGILEGFGITAVIPIFSFVNKGKAESTDFISQFIEKFFSYLHFPFTIKFLLIFILSLFVVKAIVVFVASHISAHITTTYERETRNELLDLSLKSNWSHLSTQKVGYLNQILTTDVANSSALLTYISRFLITITNLIVYILLAFNISPIIALLTVAFGLVVFFIFKPLLYKNKVLSQEVAQLYKDSAHYVDEVVIGIKAVKSMFLERQVAGRGSKYFAKLKNLSMRMVVLKNITNALLQPLGMVLVVAIFAYFYKTAAFNFASFAVIVYAINKVFANVQIAQIQLHQVSSFSPYLSAIVNYKNDATQNKEKDAGGSAFAFTRQLEFKNVSFSYGADKGVLSQIDLSIKKGEMVGIIGPSGSGKTTVTDLILRLFKPNDGEILIDGESISSIQLSDWRANIGYVSQDAFLINDTIENNIKFYNSKISPADVVKAAQMANIYEFVEDLPEKLDTMVGERGTKLSGGQRQRIILARVLATNPEILILDEATSSLDSESEALIQEAIESLKGKITVLAIAHRLSTVMSADRLVVIEDGKIVEDGHPDELLKKQGGYLSRVYQLR